MGDIRIIAGALRSRRIRVVAGERVRPTSDRVREALFDILGPAFTATSALDAFAGTGALGLEALSRGIPRVTFVESDPAVASVLRENIDRLGVGERCSVVQARVEAALASTLPGEPFDLVLADPPYSDPVRDRFLIDLSTGARLHPGARVIVESEARDAPPHLADSGLKLVRTARYGRTRLDFYALASDRSVRP